MDEAVPRPNIRNLNIRKQTSELLYKKAALEIRSGFWQ
jgi:hypothetical protein